MARQASECSPWELPPFSVVAHTQEEHFRVRDHTVQINCLRWYDQNFKKGFNGNCEIKMKPAKISPLCEGDWLQFEVRWSLEGLLIPIYPELF